MGKVHTGIPALEDACGTAKSSSNLVPRSSLLPPFRPLDLDDDVLPDLNLAPLSSLSRLRSLKVGAFDHYAAADKMRRPGVLHGVAQVRHPLHIGTLASARNKQSSYLFFGVSLLSTSQLASRMP